MRKTRTTVGQQLVFGIASTIALLQMSAATDAADALKKNRALLIGVTDYQHANSVRKLRFPEQDAIGMQKLFDEAGYDVVPLCGQLATKERIYQELDKLATGGTADGIQIIGLFGHGVQYGADPYFLPWDTEVRPATDQAGNKLFNANGAELTEPDPKTLVGLREVINKLGASKAGGKLLLFDACRDDPAAARGVDAGQRDERPIAARTLEQLTLAHPGTIALLACSEGEQAIESDSFKHGVFTHAFLDICRAKAGGDMAFERLEAELRKRVEETVARRYNKKQKPVRYGNANITLGLKTVIPGRPLPTEGLWPPTEIIKNTIQMSFVEIPAGEFVMGSTETKDALRGAGIHVDFDGFDPSDEAPLHRVRITRPFLMSTTEVTIGQFDFFYRQYKGKLDCQRAQPGKPKGGTGIANPLNPLAYSDNEGFDPWNWGHDQINADNPAGEPTCRFPIVNVSWNDAVEFCKWLSTQEGKRYRLPTEAEWEYACRGGTTGRFWIGDDPEKLAAIGKVASQDLAPNHPGAIKGRNLYKFTAPVASYPIANPFGLYDMHGNVAEWCSDWYDRNYYSVSPVNDPKGPDAGKEKVWRGGCFLQNVVCNRSSQRDFFPPHFRQCWIGFRVVREISDP